MTSAGRLLGALLLLSAALGAQTMRDSTDRVFIETYSFATKALITSGEAYTTGRIDYGNITRVLYRLPVGRRLSVSTGVGFGLRKISQWSRLDEFICDRDVPFGCTAEQRPTVRAENSVLLAEVPLQARVLLGAYGRGVYLMAGGSAQLPLWSRNEAYAKLGNGSAGTRPDGKADAVSSINATVGAGYQFRESAQNVWYVEISYSPPSTTMISDAGIANDDSSLNYQRETRIEQLGLSVGINF